MAPRTQYYTYPDGYQNPALKTQTPSSACFHHDTHNRLGALLCFGS